MSKREQVRFKAIVDWVCLNVFVFYAILLNFVYTTFLHDWSVATTKWLIYGLDKAGFEAHFLRFIHMTLFSNEGVNESE